jgi:RNA polymerase sigma-70 factor (ECF subfamily)
VSATFDEFYAAHFGTLVVQLRAAMGGDPTEAQDVVQEAFCRSWDHWDKLTGYDDPLAWVRRVAWNIAFSRWRRLRTARKYVHHLRPEPVAEPGPDRVALSAALARLPLDQRRVVVLYYLADLPISAIAQECDVPESTIRSRLHRARAALLQYLNDPEEEMFCGTVR